MATENTVEAIWRYPVKSMAGEEIPRVAVTARGLAGDRLYGVVEPATNRAAVVRSWATALMNYRAHLASEPGPDGPHPAVRIETPDGTLLDSAGAGLDERLSRDFDRQLTLMAEAPPGLLLEFPAGTVGGALAAVTEAPLSGGAPPGTFFDLAPLHLIATSTIAHLQEAHPASRIDVRRFRPNLVIASDEAAFVENSWVGRNLAIGDELVIRVTMPCMRCVNVTMAQADLPRDGGILRTIARENTVDLGDLGKLPCAGVYAEIVRPGHIRQGDIMRPVD